MEKYDKHMGYQLMVIISQSQWMLLHILRVISIVIADLRPFRFQQKVGKSYNDNNLTSKARSLSVKFGNNVTFLMLSVLLLAYFGVFDQMLYIISPK